MISEEFGRMRFGRGELIERLRLIDHRIEVIDRAMSGLFQLVSELLGTGWSHLAAGGWNMEEAGIPGGPSVCLL